MGLLSGITDFIGLTDSGAGEKAASKAGEQARLSAKEAKGYLEPAYDRAERLQGMGYTASNTQREWGRDDYLGAIDSGMTGARGELMAGRDAGLGNLTDAAGLSREALSGSMGLGREALTSGRDAAVGALQPLADASMGSLGYLQRGATAAGYGRNIENLRSGGALDPLVAENRRNLEAELAAQGLTRSGSGITDMSQIPIETLMGIEGDLYGRQGNIYQSGLPAINNISQLQSQYGANLANYERGYGQDMANLEMGLGQGMAGINTSFAPMMSNLEYGYGQDVGGAQQRYRDAYGQSASDYFGNLGRLATEEAGNLANITSGAGQAQSSAILAGAQAEAADRGVLGNILGTGLGVYTGAGGTFGMGK